MGPPTHWWPLVGQALNHHPRLADGALMERTDQDQTKRSRGAAAIEYGVLIALVAAVCIGAISLLGNATASNLSAATSSSVSDGLPTCSTEERQAFRDAWYPHRDIRTAHRDAGTWTGSANRQTRIDWLAKRTEIFEMRDAYGC